MKATNSSGPSCPHSAAGSQAEWRVASDWWSSTKRRSDAHHGPTSRLTQGCSITFARSSRPPSRRTPVATTLDAFPSILPKGRCETCDFVCVELLFLPSVYAPCPSCHGARHNAKTLEIKYRDKNIAAVLGMTVDAAFAFFAEEPHVRRSLDVLRQVGLGYLRLGQPAAV